MRYLVLAASFAALFVCVVGNASAHRLPHSQPFTAMSLVQLERFQVRALAHAKGAVRFLDRRAAKLSPVAAQERRFHRQMIRWTTRELAETRLRLRRTRMGDVDAWLCIHGGEGAWNSNTGNGYYGGLQMDIQFQATYGPPALGYGSWSSLLAAKGTADRWKPWEQIVVAEYARRSGRGFYPWPTTARRCGLI